MNTNVLRLPLILILGLACGTTLAQDTQRPRPDGWENLVLGGRFMDRFLPMPIRSPLTTNTWGVDAVKPRDVTNGIEEKEWSYWGGNIVLGDDGKYHLFVCRWPENAAKGHMAWHGSEVVHTVSDSVDGPFKVRRRIGRGHNPEVFRLEDGSYALYVMGACFRAECIDGPWSKEQFTFDPRGRRIVEGLSNLSFARREDGSFAMVCRGGGIWISQDGRAPFKQLSDGSVYPKVRGIFEDPVMWRTHVQYHMIVNDWLGRIAYYLRSPDGIHWKVDAGEAYLPGIAVYEDGTSSDWYKYERIKVFQDRHGRATHANFAVIDYSKWKDKPNDIHSSKNIVIPLTVGRLLTIENPERITAATRRIRLRIAAEPGFDPHRDVNVESLRFGAPEAVDFGGGARSLTNEKTGRDLIVVFDAKGHGLTEGNFTAKLLGRSAAGKLLFGYARLPWFDYSQPALSARAPEVRSDGDRTRVVVEVENFGQVTSERARLEVRILDGANKIAVAMDAPISALAPYEKTGVALRSEWKRRPILDHDCEVVIHHPGQAPEILHTVIAATENRPSLLEGARAGLRSDPRPNANQGLAQLIDGNTKTKLCIENKGEPVVIDLVLPHPLKAVGYTFVSAEDVPSRDPQDWEVLASDDGDEWKTLSRCVGYPRHQKRRQHKRFALDADKAYSHYRFVFRKNHGDSHFQLSELDLF